MDIFLWIYFNSVKWIEIQGTTYRPDNIVVIDSELVPIFCKIVNILLIGCDGMCVFYANAIQHYV